MDFIVLKSMPFRGKHGVYDQERNLEQELRVSIKVEIPLSRAATTDDLADTLDYDHLRGSISEIVAGESCFLIETLAERIAESVLRDTRVRSITVTIEKPAVWTEGVPSVRISRTR